jgi:hypothetical protein
MPITLQVDVSNTASPGLAALRAGLADGTAMHGAIGFAGQAAAKAHLESAGYLGRVNALGGKSTGFWRSAGEAITSEATEDTATITYRHRGVALRYWGGEVTPKTRKALSVPAHKSAHGLNASEYPTPLAFIPASTQFGPFRQGGSQDTVGYLVRGETKTVSRGPNKGKTKVVPLKKGKGGELIYVLRRRTFHKPDPNIIPPDEAILEEATKAAKRYLDSLPEA